MNSQSYSDLWAELGSNDVPITVAISQAYLHLLFLESNAFLESYFIVQVMLLYIHFP